MTEATLLPCPFCGSEAEFERIGTGNRSCIVSCTSCSCQLETGETWNSGKSWNTRAFAEEATKSAPVLRAPPHAEREPKGDPARAGAGAGEAEKLAELGSWQPIETAPHEIRVILGWQDWHSREWICEVAPASHGWRRGSVSTMSQHGQATHWMALPQPPGRHEQALIVAALRTATKADAAGEPIVEVWRGRRKVSVYPTEVLRVWGTDIEAEMSTEPRTLTSVNEAFNWLYATPPAAKADEVREERQ